jgi:hypothetical protein
MVMFAQSQALCHELLCVVCVFFSVAHAHNLRMELLQVLEHEEQSFEVELSMLARHFCTNSCASAL